MNSNIILRIAGVMLLLATFPGQSLGAIVAQLTFAASEEGWTAGFGADRSSFATFNNADGQPAGSLYAADRNDFQATWYFSSSNAPTIPGFGPNPFYGNLSAAYGNALRYDLERFIDPGAEYSEYDVRLQGVIDSDNNGTLESSLALAFGSPSLTPTLTGVWQRLSVPLVASAGWVQDTPFADPPATEAQLLAVLTNLRSVEIRGNYSIAIGDFTGLDNLQFVPESTAAALLALGWFGIFGVRRDRRFAACNCAHYRMVRLS